MLAVLALLVAPIVPTASTAALRKAPSWLSDHVDAATLVCIGTVDEVITVPFPHGIQSRRDSRITSVSEKELCFARIRVERVLKGDPRTQVVFHEAWWSTWACADARDAANVRALFCLGPGVIAAARPEDQASAAKALGTDAILRVVHSGDGIKAIRGDGDAQFVSSVHLPDGLRTAGAHEVPLADVVRWIELLARFAPEVLAIHARCRRSSALGSGATADSFDLRVLPDGTRRFARQLGEHETVVVDRIDPTVWASLQSTLRAELCDADRVLGNAVSNRDRKLTIRLDDRELAFHQSYVQGVEALDEPSKSTLRHALRAWASLWDVLDCPTCIDLRAEDARVIEAR